MERPLLSKVSCVGRVMYFLKELSLKLPTNRCIQSLAVCIKYIVFHPKPTCFSSFYLLQELLSGWIY